MSNFCLYSHYYSLFAIYFEKDCQSLRFYFLLGISLTDVRGNDKSFTIIPPIKKHIPKVLSLERILYRYDRKLRRWALISLFFVMFCYVLSFCILLCIYKSVYNCLYIKYYNKLI